MRYLLPSDTEQKTKPVDIKLAQHSVRQCGSALSVFMAQTQLMSADDKHTIVRALQAINTTLRDVASRSELNETIEKVNADASDEAMLRFMKSEEDTITGIVAGVLHAVDRLHLTGRMHDTQYRQVGIFYKAVIAMHSALIKRFEQAIN